MLFAGYILLPLYFASSTHQNEPSWIINPLRNFFAFLSHTCMDIHWKWLGDLFMGGANFMETPSRPFMLLAFTLLMIPANTLMNTFIFAVMPDICDVDELTSGQRREGLFSAVNSFISKMQNSVCSFVGLFFLLPWTGFDETLVQQSQAVLDKMRMVGFGPPILFGAITLIISFFVPLTEKYMKEVHAKLAVKRADAATANQEA